MPLHLLFPLFSSVVFVFGVMLAKQAIERGISPWTTTFLSNLWLALVWSLIAIINGNIVGTEAWGDAAIIALLFVLGQTFTYLAFQVGDVSVATPIFGVKVLIVAGLVSALTSTPVPAVIWVAGALASTGIVLIQWSGRPSKGEGRGGRIGLTILVAMTAAFCLSLFDVCLQMWAADHDSFAFLPVMFVMSSLMSIVFLFRADSPRRIVERKATPWVLGGTILMMLQAMSMCFSIANFADAPRINIVYALRGLWGVLLAWAFARKLGTAEADQSRGTMFRRLAGAGLLTAAVFLAISG